MRDRRRPYQRPDYYWQSKPQRRRRRGPRLYFRDWLMLGFLGLAGLSAVVSEFRTSSSGEEDQAVGLLDRSAFYRNCDAARAAGAAPLNVGDPGYRGELDRDGDGVACEPYYGN
jgi:hypothetical protein